MKKFSKINNYIVNEEPKKDTKRFSEEDLLKAQVYSLMEKLLCVRSYGPTDRYTKAGNLEIGGKEYFIEALMNLLSEKSLKDQTKLLESLKVKVRDLDIIDNNIDEFNKKIQENINNTELLIHKQRIKNIYETYKDDEDLLLVQFENSSNKLSKNVLEKRIEAVNQLINEGYPSIFVKISEIYNKKK
jgi:hypothetical protein